MSRFAGSSLLKQRPMRVRIYRANNELWARQAIIETSCRSIARRPSDKPNFFSRIMNFCRYLEWSLTRHGLFPVSQQSEGYVTMTMMPLEQHSQPVLVSIIEELNERIARLERDNIALAAEKTSLQKVVASLRQQVSQGRHGPSSGTSPESSKQGNRLLQAEA